MDPLSLTASLITVIATVKQVKKGLKQLKGLRNAPRELDDLLDENSQFGAILEAIDNTPWKLNGVGPELQTVLSKAHAKLNDFDALIQYTLTEAGTSSKVDRLQWVRRRREVEGLRDELKDITLRIVSLVGVETNTTVSHVYSGQQELTSMVSQISSGQQEMKDQIAAAVSGLCQKIEEDRSLQSALTGLLGQFRQTTLESGSEVDTVLAQNLESSLLQSRRSRHFGGGLGDFQVHRHQTLNICPNDCRCKCHRVRNLNIPSLLGMLGRGYAEIFGTSLFGSRCDDRSCRAPSAPYVMVVYVLPRWAAMRMIFLRYSASSVCGPEFVLRVPRVVRVDNAGFAAIVSGDLDRFKRTIASGVCTPYDVQERGDYLWSLLEVASRFRSVEIIWYLITLGVSGQTPIIGWDQVSGSKTFDMVLWDDYVMNPLLFVFSRKSRDQQLLQYLDFDEFAEDHGFTTLHRIACRIDIRDLDLEVQRHPHDINKLDKHNRSPLWYAVAHCNTQFVRCLLRQGADPNLGGRTVMTEAIKLAQLEIVELLIAFGFNMADLNVDALAEAWMGDTRKRLEICSLIIKHWVDVNGQTTCGMTLLMFLCSHQIGSTDRIDQLIRRGAELELRNNNGETALFFCIDQTWGPNYGAFLVLAHAGARLDVRDYAGATVLHHLVHCRIYYRTYLMALPEAMTNIDVSQFDLEAKDKDGYTAFDLLKKRNGITWESYYMAKRGERWVVYKEQEISIIQRLESLFHRIQDSQGIPKEQQYPPLADYLCEQTDDEPIPGAWPL